MGLFLRENHLLRCWGCLSHLNWLGALTLSLLLKLLPRKLEPWFALWSFFLLRLLYISIILSYVLAWNCCTVFRSAPSCHVELLDKLQKRILHNFSVTILKMLRGFICQQLLSWYYCENYLLIDCFPLTYDLNGSFKSRIKRHLLIVGSF